MTEPKEERRERRMSSPIMPENMSDFDLIVGEIEAENGAEGSVRFAHYLIYPGISAVNSAENTHLNSFSPHLTF